MEKKRLHGGAALEQQVMRLYKEGWHLENIASISGAGVVAVRDILSRSGVILD